MKALTRAEARVFHVLLSPAASATGRKTSLALVGIRDARSVRETIRGVVYQATHSQLFTRST